MKRVLIQFALLASVLSLAVPPAARADASHARIVRLSVLEGDVRFARAFHDNSITDPNAVWETAQLNLPIREGNVLATGNGRAEVEFENGAMAFLGVNTVVEFYDLSLHDGGKITRLILRQGSASFHEQSQVGDYFSVTGGDFSVAVDGKATFRLENFEDGSTVSILSGHVEVLQNDKSTPLDKGQSLLVHTDDPLNQVIGRLGPVDDFDRWVSGRIQNQELVNSQTTTYGSSSNYVAGYSDLYTYGSWMSVGGFNCWRPFGAGLGWSPFDYGNWYFDNGFGWSFLGSSPWGWLPYHYGGWIFSPAYGWVWNPGGAFYGKPQPYHPVTAVFVRNGATLGVVPMHPGDKPGKTALNLGQGVYPVEAGAIGKKVAVAGNEAWSVERNAAKSSSLLKTISAPAVAPVPISRTIRTSNLSARGASFGRTPLVAYDQSAHRFVSAAASNSHPSRMAETAGARNQWRTAVNSSLTGAKGFTPRPSALPAPARSYGGGASASTCCGGRGGYGGGSTSGGSTSAGSSAAASSSAGSSHPASGGGGRSHP